MHLLNSLFQQQDEDAQGVGKMMDYLDELDREMKKVSKQAKDTYDESIKQAERDYIP